MEIGKVRLNLEFYNDAILYSDGDIEEELLKIVRTTEDYDAVLLRETRWPILYHLHKDRENILAWYPFTGEEETLEIGAGCGALTGLLAKNCKSVLCNDISLRRSKINAYKNSDYDNIEILVGSFSDIKLDKKFDIITLIGVLEYAGLYVQADNPYVEMLKKIKAFLKPGGKVLIAIENRFGLKYWAGCREDHTGRYYDGLEGYPDSKGIRTFSKKELQEILNQSGLTQYKFYYPMPDYKFAKMIFSDERSPQSGEIRNEPRNFDSDRLVTFDENAVLNQVIQEGMFEFFANSYFVDAGVK